MKYGVGKFEGRLRVYDAVCLPKLNSNIISSVYLRFVEPTTTTFTWLRNETCLAMFILDTEIQDLKENLDLCTLQIYVGDQKFDRVDGSLIEFVLKNNIEGLSLVSDKDIKTYMGSYIRYTTSVDGGVDFDKIYMEAVRGSSA